MTNSQVEVNEKLQQAERMKKSPESPNNKAVFENGMPPYVIALESATGEARARLPGLHNLQKMNPTEERAQKIVDLERQRGRVARFSFLQTRATPEQKEILKEKDTLEKLKASDILLLKKK